MPSSVRLADYGSNYKSTSTSTDSSGNLVSTQTTAAIAKELLDTGKVLITFKNGKLEVNICERRLIIRSFHYSTYYCIFALTTTTNHSYRI